MNVTVHVAGPLRAAVDGRRKVELGVPAFSDLGDVLQTLFTLYPKLQGHLPHEGKARALQLALMYDAPSLRMREGERVYLVADQPRRLADSAA